jgi:glycosyltransferase involved in cell wall biosynthesis
MNILYINHYAGSIHHGMEYRPYYLAREWVLQGHNVVIVAANYSHIRMHNITMADNEQYKTEMIDGIKYIWCKTPEYPGNGIKRIINIFTFLYRLKRLVPRLLKSFKPEVVVASSTYPFDTVIAAQIAKQTTAKFIYEVHDLWPLTPMELGGMSKYHPFIWLMQKAEDFGYRHADKVVSLLPKAKNYMQQHGMHPDKFIYIPNGVSVRDWQNIQNRQQVQQPQQSQQLLGKNYQQQIQQIKDKHHFLIGYAGGMGDSNALKYLISAITSIKDQKFACVLVGDGACKQDLIRQLQAENITNVFFLDPISKNHIPDFLSKIDAFYIGWNNLPIYRFGISPNKLFDYMLANKPIIHSVTAGNDLVVEANCGISIPAEDVGAITNAIKQMLKTEESKRHGWGQNGYQYVIQHHDYAKLAQQFIEN